MGSCGLISSSRLYTLVSAWIPLLGIQLRNFSTSEFDFLLDQCNVELIINLNSVALNLCVRPCLHPGPTHGKNVEDEKFIIP